MSRNGKRRLSCAGAVIACLTVIVAAAPAAEREMPDREIAAAVEREIHYSPAVDLNDVDVESSKGVVTLTGAVSSLLAKERAQRLAGTVSGVRSVVNRIEVAPARDRADRAIEQDAEKALLYDAATETFEVTVEVKEGDAVLMGQVESLAEKVQCARVVSGVRGVREVENRIQVAYERGRPDAEIRRDVQKSLRWDALVDHALILVDVDRGEVTLDGTVGSAAEIRQARRDAWVSGVKGVDVSGLEVATWAERSDLREDKYMETTDAAVAEAVNRAVRVDPRVRSSEVEAAVDEGVVTLRGVVGHVRARRAAGADARNTVGVRSVINRVKVRPEDRRDREIEESIRQALDRDPVLEPYDLDVSVIGGRAYLYGEVASYYEKGLADNVASRAGGLEGVRNFIEVDVPGPLTYDPHADDHYPYTRDWYNPQPYYSFKSDEEIRDQVREELWWSPYVDEEQVEVTVDDGTVILTGTVDTPGERRAAAENAYEGGAAWLRNQLRVR